MTRDEIQDFTLRITHANSTQMIVVLYDIILTYTKDAKENMAKEEKAALKNSVSNLRNCFKELMNSVDTSYELGHNLLKLYVFCQGEITRAVTSSQPEHFDNITNVISGLRESYSQISALDYSEPIMGNTEKVYAGLTYNPYGQSESMVEASSSRGYLA